MPPYDTAATLEALAAVIARYAARMVIALGDNFHDGGGPARLAATDRAQLHAHCSAAATGSGSPAITTPIRAAASAASSPARLALGALVVPPRSRRKAAGAALATKVATESLGEISGHLHPAARIHQRGRTQTRKCFATDGERLVMPAFGAFTGGLNIRNAAFLKVFGALGFTAHLLGQRRLYSFAAARCLAD